MVLDYLGLTVIIKTIFVFKSGTC